MKNPRTVKERQEFLIRNGSHVRGVDGKLVKTDPELNSEFWAEFDAANNDASSDTNKNGG